MSKLSPEAARLKYQYNKKYQDRYWERKAAKQREQSGREAEESSVSVSRSGRNDEQYIADLENSNKALNRENRRLVKLLQQYQTIIEQSTVVHHDNL